VVSAMAVTVVQDAADLLAVHLAAGTPFEFPECGPTPHPWSTHRAWSGLGVLMLHRPQDAYAIWVFWAGEPRKFDRWYVNFQRPLSRTADGFETLDHEIDLWSRDLKTWYWKDPELFAERVHEGWFTPYEAAAIKTNARRTHNELDSGGAWWDAAWADWAPPAPRK